jgi:DNA-binding response OmpR family regulator
VIAVSKPRVLVIEDEPDILEVITYNLEREGHGDALDPGHHGDRQG